MSKKVTILIPNYKTPELTKLCLRLIKKHTDFNLIKIIVIDNDSRDKSLAYLRSLKDIRLIERSKDPEDSPPVAHAKALDLALQEVTTPYVLSIHTDTLIKKTSWLKFLLSFIENEPNVACVGSWKLEVKSFIQRLAKTIENFAQILRYRLTHQEPHTPEGIGDNFYYLRSHCALYRTDLLKKLKLSFAMGRENAGKLMYKKLEDAGFKTVFIPPKKLICYMVHANHATTVLNPQLGSRKKSISKGNKRLYKTFKALNAKKILNDSSLDF